MQPVSRSGIEVSQRWLYTRIGAGIVVLALEATAVVTYVDTAGATGTPVWYLVYPLIWINLTLAAVLAARRQSLTGSTTTAAIATGYFFLLAWAGGLVSIGGNGSGLTVHGMPPGWGPMVVYDHTLVAVSLVPFRVIGYLGLSYLVYVALGRSFRSGAAGLLGVFSCVSCTAPVLALFGGVFAGSSVAILDAIGWSQELSLLVFATSLVALIWVLEQSTAGAVPGE